MIRIITLPIYNFEYDASMMLDFLAFLFDLIPKPEDLVFGILKFWESLGALDFLVEIQALVVLVHAALNTCIAAPGGVRL